MLLGQWCKFLPDGSTQRLWVHPRQRPQVKLQGALATDPVGIVTAMDAAEVQGGLRHAELGVVELFLPLLTQLHQFAHHLVHGFQRAVAKTRVRRMAAATKNIDTVHHHAFVQADRFEPGGLADHCCPAQRAPCLGQGPGARHRAFFITGGKNQERLLEVMRQQRLHRLNDQGEEAFHVATAQANPAPVDFGQLEWIGLPQARIIGHRVTVTGQHQPTGARAVTGQQIEFARRYLLDIAGKTQVAQPTRQQVDHRTVGLVQRSLGATDRRRGNQRGELVFERWQGHARSPQCETHHRAIGHLE
ncbi:hypothetical protein D3C78_449460 [compost metagenome]